MVGKIDSVLMLDGVNPICEEILRKAGITVKSATKLPKEQLLEEIKASYFI